MYVLIGGCAQQKSETEFRWSEFSGRPENTGGDKSIIHDALLGFFFGTQNEVLTSVFYDN